MMFLSVLLLVVTSLYSAVGLSTSSTIVQQRRRVLFDLVSSSSFLLTASSASALTPNEAETLYDTAASSYDELDGGTAASSLGIDKAREDLIQQASGNVLEIGVGTGLNLDKYQKDKLKSLTVVDISEGMLREATVRIKSLPNLKGVKVKIVKADATSDLLDTFGPQAFDTVIDSFSLCVMGNSGAKACLDQISRVVTKGGRVLLLENSRSSNPLLGLYQDATADLVAPLGGKGCVYNQDVEAMINASGKLRIDKQTLYAAGLFRSFECTSL
jgi:methyltransferase OMS1